MCRYTEPRFSAHVFMNALSLVLTQSRSRPRILSQACVVMILDNDLCSSILPRTLHSIREVVEAYFRAAALRHTCSRRFAIFHASGVQPVVLLPWTTELSAITLVGLKRRLLAAAGCDSSNIHSPMTSSDSVVDRVHYISSSLPIPNSDLRLF